MPLRVAMLVLGVALGLWARAVAAASVGISFAARTPSGWIYLLGVGWSVMVAAVVLARERRRTALLLYAIGVWWFLTELAGPSVGVPLAFTIGLLFYGAGPALVAHLALSYPTGRLQRWPYRIIVAAGYAVLVGVIGVAATAAYDPASTGCLTCPGNLLALGADPALSGQLNQVGLRLGAGWLLLAVGAVTWRAISAGRGTRSSEASVALPSAVCLGVNAVHYLTSLSAGMLAVPDRHLIIWQIEGATLLGLAAASCVDLSADPPGTPRPHPAGRAATRCRAWRATSSAGATPRRSRAAHRLPDRRRPTPRRRRSPGHGPDPNRRPFLHTIDP